MSPSSALYFAPMGMLSHPPSAGANPNQEGLTPGGDFWLQTPSVQVGGGLQDRPDLPCQPLLPWSWLWTSPAKQARVVWPWNIQATRGRGRPCGPVALWPRRLVYLLRPETRKCRARSTTGWARAGGQFSRVTGLPNPQDEPQSNEDNDSGKGRTSSSEPVLGSARACLLP